jgi:hypothetical protein
MIDLGCDSNDNGNIEFCEYFYCAIETENMWRLEHCLNYGDLNCGEYYECPAPETCVG